VLDLEFHQRPAEFSLTFKVERFENAVLKLAPNLPAGARIQSVQLDGKPMPHQVHQLPEATVSSSNSQGFRAGTICAFA